MQLQRYMDSVTHLYLDSVTYEHKYSWTLLDFRFEPEGTYPLFEVPLFKDGGDKTDLNWKWVVWSDGRPGTDYEFRAPADTAGAEIIIWARREEVSAFY